MSTTHVPLTPDQEAQQDKSPEPWKLTYLASVQARADARFADNIFIFNNGAASWLMDAKQDQSLGVPVPPFTLKVPQRSVYYLMTGQPMLLEILETDPEVKPPVMPVFIPPTNHGTQLSTSAPAQADAVIGMLSELLMDMAMVKGALGLK